MDIKKALTFMFKDKDILPFFLFFGALYFVPKLVSWGLFMLRDIFPMLFSNQLLTVFIVKIVILFTLVCFFVNVVCSAGYCISTIKNTSSDTAKVLINPFTSFISLFVLGIKLFFASLLFFVPISLLLYLFRDVLILCVVWFGIVIFLPALLINFLSSSKLTAFYHWKSAFETIRTAPLQYFLMLVVAYIPFILLFALLVAIVWLLNADAILAVYWKKGLFNLCFYIGYLYCTLIMCNAIGQYYGKYIKKEN